MVRAEYRERLRNRLSWVALAAAVAVLASTAVVLSPLPHNLVPVWNEAAIVMILAACFGSLARTDRVAFASFALPATIVVLFGFVVPRVTAYQLGLAAIVFLAFVEFGPNRFRWWWWRVVLRRPGQAFGFALVDQLRRLDKASNALLLHTVRDRDQGLRDFDRAVAGLRGLHAPAADWAAIRDAYVELDREWRERLREDGPSEGYQDIGAQFGELRARVRDALNRQK